MAATLNLLQLMEAVLATSSAVESNGLLIAMKRPKNLQLLVKYLHYLLDYAFHEATRYEL